MRPSHGASTRHLRRGEHYFRRLFPGDRRTANFAVVAAIFFSQSVSIPASIGSNRLPKAAAAVMGVSRRALTPTGLQTC